MDLAIIMLVLRLGLIVSALHHLWEVGVRPEGTAWRTPMDKHLQGAAMSIAAFAVAAAALVSFDFTLDTRLIPADLAIMGLVMFAIGYPPWNAVSEEGVVLAGRRYPWDRYLAHDAEPPEDGYQLVRFEYTMWRFSFRKNFYAPPEAVRGLDHRGRVPDERRIGRRRPRRRGWS